MWQIKLYGDSLLRNNPDGDCYWVGGRSNISNIHRITFCLLACASFVDSLACFVSFPGQSRRQASYAGHMLQWPTRARPHALKAHDMGFLRTYGKLNKWLNDVKGVMGLSKMTSNFKVQDAQIQFSFHWVWVCLYRVVSWLISDWWKVLIVPPSTTTYQNLTQTPWRWELNAEVPSKELCSEFSLPSKRRILYSLSTSPKRRNKM